MSNYKGHIAGAVIVTSIIMATVLLLPFTWVLQVNNMLSNWYLVSSLIIVAILFGLWPDVDTNSKGQDIFMLIAFLADLALIYSRKYELAAYLGLFAMLPILGKHRGWTHKKWAMIIVPLPILLIAYLASSNNQIVGLLFYFSAVAGYFSHLLLDGLIFKHFRIKG